MRKYLVKDWMKLNPITIPGNTSIPDAYWKMVKNNIRRLVVEEKDKPVGIVTINDLRQKVPFTTFAIDPVRAGDALAHCPVSKVMSTKPKFISRNEHLLKAAQCMIDNHFSTLLVKDNDKLVGIITESDIFHAFVDIFSNEILSKK